MEPVGLVDTAKQGGFESFSVKLQAIAEVKKETVEAYSKPLLAATMQATGVPGLTAELTSITKDEKEEEWVLEFKTSAKVSYEKLESATALVTDEFGRTPLAQSHLVGLDAEDTLDGHVEATSWQTRITDATLQATSVIPALQKEFATELKNPGGFSAVNYIGPNVVAGLKVMAITAIILSLIAIILYIWFRFKEVKYGVGAAVAVFHDVIVALGVVVLCNMLGLVNVPLNLPIIAAFLTIIGYSLNDTIVLFDRVRENLGNIQGDFENCVNVSINQTLARTVLTSLTTFLVVGILYVVNIGTESAIEGIAFTLMIGVVVGTYSSIFVASPVILWLAGREEAKKANS